MSKSVLLSAVVLQFAGIGLSYAQTIDIDDRRNTAIIALSAVSAENKMVSIQCRVAGADTASIICHAPQLQGGIPSSFVVYTDYVLDDARFADILQKCAHGYDVADQGAACAYKLFVTARRYASDRAPVLYAVAIDGPVGK